MASKELAVIADTYPALGGGNAVIEALRENVDDGDTLNEFDLARIKIPGGGATSWEINDADGEPQPHKTFNGIIVMQRSVRTFWRESLDAGGSKPPDCSSPDAKVGFGDPGGDCKTCPYSQWESDPKGGKGQACSQRKQLYVLLEGDSMPTVLSLPPTSLKAVKDYLMRISQQGVPHTGAVTTFGLEKVDGANAYSRVVLKLADRLDSDATNQVRAFAAILRPIFLEMPATVGVTSE